MSSIARKFTPDEITEICEKYNCGMSSVEISRQYDRTHQTIRQLLKRCGVKIRSYEKRPLNNLTNIRFGKLIALKRGIDLPLGKNVVTWDCICDCGNYYNAARSNLISGSIKSCGCQRKLPEGEAALNRIYGHYKNNAKKKKREFSLDKEQFRKITSSNCFYCGCIPNQKGNKSKNNNGDYIHNGVDRIDSSRGYTEDNVVPCCHRCNYSKRSQSLDSFLTWINTIFNNLKDKGLL